VGEVDLEFAADDCRADRLLARFENDAGRERCETRTMGAPRAWGLRQITSAILTDSIMADVDWDLGRLVRHRGARH
jgi:hypothetical protein